MYADLCFLTYAKNRPHPEKVSRGGEDAWFVRIDPSGGSFGVADGVGGYDEYNVDPGLYARNMMLVAEQTTAAQGEQLDPQAAIAAGHASTELPGACTACVIQLDGKKNAMLAANVGDSGFRIIRNGKTVFTSPALQHYFDCPYQLCWDGQDADIQSDSAEDADLFNIELKEGDIIVAASDGLYDNVYPEDIEKVINAQMENFAGNKLQGVQAAATALSGLASEHAADEFYDSPYAKECTADEEELLKAQTDTMAKKAGAFGGLVGGMANLMQQEPCVLGGKQDDITIVIAVVVDKTRESAALTEAAKQAAEDLTEIRTRLETQLKVQAAQKEKPKKTPVEGTAFTREEIEGMDKKVLQNILKQNDLPTSGKLDKLKERVIELYSL